jgi:Cof subfamily protein (haloacid dehalogenase superfamily)
MKAIFLDIDGTLVSTVTHIIPQSAKEALLEAHDAGHKLFISTGRTIMQFPYLEDIPFDGYLTLNGAFECTGGVAIPKEGTPSIGSAEVIFSRTFEPEVKQRIADWQDSHEKFPMLAMSDTMATMTYIDERVIAYNKMVNIDATKIQVMDLHERIKYPVHQFCAFVSPEAEKNLAKVLFHGCDLSRWNSYFMDVNQKWISKKRGMDEILNYFNIPVRDTIAFGDGGNDIPIIKHAALGIAMANGNLETKEAADYVTDSVDEDGISNALRKFVL